MIDATEADTGPRMGRPPLGLTRIPVRLAPDVIEEIDRRVGEYRRPTFIREAVAEKLAREGANGEQTPATRTQLGQGPK